MPEKHFYEQRSYAEKYLIPYFEKNLPSFNRLKVLEVGCAEAGLMDLFSELGFDVTGVEIDKTRAEIAKEKNPNLHVIVGDISENGITRKLDKDFDLIIMREVIEHIDDKETTFKNLNALLKIGGHLFVTFPPKYSPFAGHQQVGLSLLKAVPWIHLFPRSLLQMFVKLLNEHPNFINHIKYNYSTGMAIYLFEKLYKKYDFEAVLFDLYIFRPIYKLRFGLPTIKNLKIKGINEISTFGCEALLKKIGS